MNNTNLLRVGMPLLGVCLAAALQSGCRSTVMEERTSVPPAISESQKNDENLPNDDAFADDSAAVQNVKADDTAPATAAPAKQSAYPRFEDTDNTPIYSAPKSAAKSKPAVVPAGATYTVVRGDSLSKIAARHRIKTSDLAKANNLQINSIIRIGQKLVIPGNSASASKSAAPAPKAKKAQAMPSSGLYTVVKGDSLSKIAAKFNIKTIDLAKANDLQMTAILRIGQTLKLPGATVVNEESVIPAKAAPASETAATETTADAAPAEKQEVNSGEADILADLDNRSGKQADAPASAAEAVSEAEQQPAVASAAVNVTFDISVDDFCKNHQVKKEDLIRVNPALEGKTAIPSGTLIIMP